VKDVTARLLPNGCDFTDIPVPTTTRALTFVSATGASITGCVDTVAGVQHTILLLGSVVLGQVFTCRLRDKTRYYEYRVTVST
jgi:hypothetical protein